MTDGSKVWIEHEPAQAGQPGIGCAVVAKPRGVGSDAGTGADGRREDGSSTDPAALASSASIAPSRHVARAHPTTYHAAIVSGGTSSLQPIGSKTRNAVLNNDRFDSPPSLFTIAGGEKVKRSSRRSHCILSVFQRWLLLEADPSSSGTDFNALGLFLAHLCKWKPPLANNPRNSPASSFASLIVSHDVARSSTYMFSKISAAARGAASW
ncbi:hypothetical protein T07_686 [Trichinella nelsoni]|uniref:Uncharacterized protein n=1 Tax=Trichinella nelsoni TaxID=6336 RepID=A0A0V0RVJ4_9BILA|nr:hypothetical protein T07_686 [Trichinella nelsoni]